MEILKLERWTTQGNFFSNRDEKNKTADLDEEIQVMASQAGEGAKNGIVSCQEEIALLTNKACYLFKASDSRVKEV